MADDETKSAQPWTAADLLDFEYFLNAESDPAKDRASAQEKLSSEFGGDLRPDAKPVVRAAVFRRWLERQRSDASGKTSFSPGETFDHSRRIIGAIVAILSVMAGASLVFGLMNHEWRYFNVLLFLAVTLLPQLFLLVLLIGGWIFRRSITRSRTMGFVQTLAQSAIGWLSKKAWLNKAGDKAGSSWQSLQRRPYLVWPVTAITQSAGVLFNVGIVLGFIGCLLVMDVRFFWESTPAVKAAESLHALASGLAAPWSWAFPSLVPALEEIQQTSIQLTGGEEGLEEKIDSAEAWAPFLIATILIWGLLPRLLLRGIAGWMGRRSVRSYSFNERPHRELWRRLTDVPHVEAVIEGSGDDAAVIAWGGIDPDAGELRKACLQQLRLNPVATFRAGGPDPDGDGAAIEKLASLLKKSPNVSRVILLADSWGLAPRDLMPFLKTLRESIGADVPLIALLAGAPNEKDSSAFTEPDSKDVAVWEEFAADLGDANFTIHPFRSNRVESVTEQG